MEYNLWNILVGYTYSQYEIDTVAAELYDSEISAKSRNQRDTLTAMLNSKDTTAIALVEYIYEILWDTQMFELDDASILSGGMLTRESSGDLRSKDILSSILIPNLYCVLLLEANGQWNTAEKISLRSLREQHPFDSDGKTASYVELCRTLENDFPDILRSLFDKSAASSGEYNVCTQYPKLFLAIASAFKKSPIAPNEKTATSLVSNAAFYDLCMSVIAPDNNWFGADKSGQPLIEYYLFERLFRLNTKFKLFQADYEARMSADVLSPVLLADFFFSSPLVFFPKNMLTSLLYSKTAEDQYDIKEATSFLHFLIQLSSFWFPVILSFLRIYMRKFNITTRQSVQSFLFQNPADFETIIECGPFTSGFSKNTLYRIGSFEIITS